MNRLDSTSHSDFAITVVNNLDHFQELRDSWNQLANRCGSYTPWLTHEWFQLNLHHFFGREQLLILLFHRGDSLCAVAPFAVTKETYKSVPAVRKVELIGNVHSPIRTILLGNLDKTEKDDVVNSAIYFLANTFKDWDIIEFDTIPVEEGFFQRVKSAVERAGYKHRHYLCAVNWYLDDITPPYKTFFLNLPKSLKKDVSYCERRLHRESNCRIELKTDGDSADRFLSLYDDVRTRSWKAPERNHTFNRDFNMLLAEKGWARFGFLFKDTEPIALQKWAVCRGKAYAVDIVHDEAYKKFSPGKVLTSKTVQYVIDHDGVTEIDQLRGDEPYKKDWTPKKRERRGITVFNRTAKGSLLAWGLMTIYPFLKRTSIYGVFLTKRGIR